MKTDVLLQSLKRLGFDTIEAKLYEKLISLKNPTVAGLAKMLNVQRPRVYEGLKRLQQLGLLEKKQDYSRKFSIEPPSKLIALLRNEEVETKRLTEDLTKLLPDLLSQFHASVRQPSVAFYEGREQFAILCNQILEEVKDEFLYFGSAEHFIDLIGYEFEREWIRRRVAKGIHIRVLAFPGFHISKARGNDQKELREVKLLPKEFSCDGSFHIFGANVVQWNPVLPKAIMIEDKIISGLMRNMFEMIWSIHH